MRVTLVKSREDAARAYRDWSDAVARGDGLLAFDTETTGLLVRSGSQDRGRTIQFSWRPWGKAVVFEMTPEWIPAIEAFFILADQLVGHHTKFDVHVVQTYLGVNLFDEFAPDRVHDTRYLARLFDERTETGLKPLSEMYLRAGAGDLQRDLKALMRKNGWTWATVPVEHLVEYGGADAALTGELFDHLRPKIDFAEEAYLREQRLQPLVYSMERTGVLVDRRLVEHIIAEEEAKMRFFLEKAEELAPGVNIASPKQLLDAFEKRGLPIPNTQAATLKALDDDLARAVTHYRDAAKTVSTYARPWLEVITDDDRIHPSLNPTGTITGRFSSDSPNFQNISKGHRLREAIVAAPGHTLVVADWHQVELRLYAHYAADENMRAAFLSGDDIYQQVADLLGVSRQVGKMVMLASIYGAGPRKLGEQVVAMAWKYGMADLVPELQGLDWGALHERFHANYGIRRLAQATELVARRRESYYGEAFITTWGGRRQRPKVIKLPRLKNGYTPTQTIYKDLANSLIQGSAADLMKQALIDIGEAGYGPFLRLTVHDEVVLEVPDHLVPQVVEEVGRLMYWEDFVPPLTAEVGTGKNYGSAK